MTRKFLKSVLSLTAIVLVNISSFGQVDISHKDAKKIAFEHNKYLTEFIKSNPVNLKDLNYYFNNISFEGVSEEEKNKYFTNYSYDSNLEILKKHITNKKVFEVINNSNIIVENDKINLSEINNKLEYQLEYAKKNLKGVDLQVCLVYIEVLKKSANFG